MNGVVTKTSNCCKELKNVVLDVAFKIDDTELVLGLDKIIVKQDFKDKL